ncbi:hypothetical protein PEL8287_00098 [Roseovarius litorisediminis]|uniref:Excinuclease ABC subunit A n=1 Tax=Roseovarius litorisediminis TaxID=1312363 RepID=A0A1Y5R5R0_9RHOB|nr:excinuclease ABC subunit A [Roseovarius litorisediminis]SLN09773.1 hypothetical protein PEL8287_00098 [Roseovarius litorisediminis]
MRLALYFTAAAMALSAGAAMGDGSKGQKYYKDCPPGLAKKHNGCLPPGHAKSHHRYRIGDRIHDDYSVIRHPGRHGLDPDESYYRVGDYIYRVDRDTRKVLDLVGAAVAVLN